MKKYKLTKDEVFALLIDQIPKEPKIVSLAENARSLYFYSKMAGINSSSFPMLGSMGQEISMGLGVALGTEKDSKRKIVVVSSDGSFFTNINALATISILKPKNLIIIVLDNEVHGITGGQLTASRYSDPAVIAGSFGIKSTKVSDLRGFQKSLQVALKDQQTWLINVKVNRQKPKSSNIDKLPSSIFQEFSGHLKKIRD